MCDMDCFNCKLPDCNNNMLETKKERIMKGEILSTGRSKYYYKNREKILEKQKIYNAAHKEERSAYRKRYYEEHREEIIRKESERIKRKRKHNLEWAKSEREKAKERYRKRHANCNSD